MCFKKYKNIDKESGIFYSHLRKKCIMTVLTGVITFNIIGFSKNILDVSLAYIKDNKVPYTLGIYTEYTANGFTRIDNANKIDLDCYYISDKDAFHIDNYIKSKYNKKASKYILKNIDSRNLAYEKLEGSEFRFGAHLEKLSTDRCEVSMKLSTELKRINPVRINLSNVFYTKGNYYLRSKGKHYMLINAYGGLLGKDGVLGRNAFLDDNFRYAVID